MFNSSTFFKKWYVVTLEFLIVLFSGFLIWNSEQFQEILSPSKYWEQKVTELETEVQMDHYKIKKLVVQLQKEDLLYDIDRIEFKDNENSPDFQEKLAKKHQENKDKLKKQIEEKTRLLVVHQDKLNGALSHLHTVSF